MAQIRSAPVSLILLQCRKVFPYCYYWKDKYNFQLYRLLTALPWDTFSCYSSLIWQKACVAHHTVAGPVDRTFFTWLLKKMFCAPHRKREDLVSILTFCGPRPGQRTKSSFEALMIFSTDCKEATKLITSVDLRCALLSRVDRSDVCRARGFSVLTWSLF